MPQQTAIASQFAQNVKLHRNRLRWSQQVLADILHLDRSVVSRWESGERIPDLNQARAIADAFQISLDELC